MEKKNEYSWHLNNAEVRGCNPPTTQSTIHQKLYSLALCVFGSTFEASTNKYIMQYCGVYLLEKKKKTHM